MTNLIFGGIMPISSARTALIKLVRPDAASEWPTLGFTYTSQYLMYLAGAVYLDRTHRADEDTLVTEDISDRRGLNRVASWGSCSMTLPSC